jgi:ubiquinone/menaquinone biosynthesis C-methylase UbiE
MERITTDDSMVDEYARVADDYDLSFKHLPFRTHVEAYSVLRRVGDVKRLHVLDAACGTGHYARILRRAGAARVVGVDISEAMLDLARSIEGETELGIEYAVADASTLDSVGPFDLVVAVYMLHYAPTVEVLQGMCTSMARNMKPGARVVAFVMNPDVSTTRGAYRQYGMTLRAPETRVEGGPVHFSLQIPNVPPVEITAFRWSRDTYAAALTEAGFVDLQWGHPTVSPAGVDAHGAEFWAPYLERPHCVLVSARKRG